MTGAPAFSSALRAAVEAVLPGADLDGATLLGEGWACVAWRVRDSSSATLEARDWALRVPKPRSWWAVADLEKEALLLPALERWGLAVPGDAHLVRNADGETVAALQRVVEGAPALRAPLGREGARFAEDTGRFLARLHAFPSTSARDLGVRDGMGEWSGGMWEGHYRPLIEEAGALLPKSSARWLEGRARRFLDDGGIEAAPVALIHADLSGSHLLAREDGSLAGVIDWADAVLGDPALDFAGLLNDYRPRFLERVLAAYEAGGGTVDGDAMRRVRFYLDVAPIFGVLYASTAGFPQVERADRRKLAARAAAATRHAPRS